MIKIKINFKLKLIVKSLKIYSFDNNNLNDFCKILNLKINHKKK